MALIPRPSLEERLEFVNTSTIAQNWRNFVANSIKEFPSLVGACSTIESLSPDSFYALSKIVDQYTVTGRPSASLITPNHILDTCFDLCKEWYDIPKESILSTRRTDKISKSRWLCAFTLKQMSTLVLDDIGIMLGGIDHSTVSYIMKNIHKRCGDDVKNFVYAVNERIG